MQIAKVELEKIIRDLPEIVDMDEVIYQLYLLQKIEAGEQDIRNGKVLSHEKATQRLIKKWQS
jgi:hypothetical protein